MNVIAKSKCLFPNPTRQAPDAFVGLSPSPAWQELEPSPT
jgi:hypothetical protein